MLCYSNCPAARSNRYSIPGSVVMSYSYVRSRAGYCGTFNSCESASSYERFIAFFNKAEARREALPFTLW